MPSDALNLYWGDLHTHLEDFEHGEQILQSARENIDFGAVLCYPFIWLDQNGLRVETVRQRPEYAGWWVRLQDLARAHHEAGRFVTFLGYEWHGNRTRYGDHNVIYYGEDNPLDDAWDLPELYQRLRARRALAIPHHTAYQLGQRGKDWDIWHEALSPVMEIYSQHGSSEGCGTPLPLEHNPNMGPRTSGGSFQDALRRGYRIGVIASNDGPGLPGRWGLGRTAVWARECTREAIWDALNARRCYAVTGDRIVLEMSVQGKPMGSQLTGRGTVDVEVSVVGSQALDRIELVNTGVVADTYCHAGSWERNLPETGRLKVFVQAGWGPKRQKGYLPQALSWHGRLDVLGGRLIGVERCFSTIGQRVSRQGPQGCAWDLLTSTDVPGMDHRALRGQGLWQGLILEVEGAPDARIRLLADEALGAEGSAEYTLRELLGEAHLLAFTEESRRRTPEAFGLSPQDIANPDTYYHNARKLKVHRAIPEAGYRVQHTFHRVPLRPGRNALYVRVSQTNGQLAWSSPIWVDAAS